MISVKYSETDFCVYSDYGCRDSSCPLNRLHEPEEATFGLHDIEPTGCLRIVDMLCDEDLDGSIRDWIKAGHIEGKPKQVPQAIRDIGDGKKPKISTPLERWVRGENVRVGPGVVLPENGNEPRIKDLRRHVREK